MQVAPPKVQIFSSLANYYSSFFCFSSMPSPFLPGNTAFSMRKIRINLYTGNYLEYFLWFSLKIGWIFDFTGRYFNIPGSFRAVKTAFRPWFLPSKKMLRPHALYIIRSPDFSLPFPLFPRAFKSVGDAHGCQRCRLKFRRHAPPQFFARLTDNGYRHETSQVLNHCACRFNKINRILPCNFRTGQQTGLNRDFPTYDIRN